MPAWLLYCLLAVLLWGGWAFLPKVATQTLDPRSALLFQQIGSLLATLTLLLSARGRIAFTPVGFACAVGVGLLGIAGQLFFLKALARHPAAAVVAITSLYPVVAIVLSALFLKERLSPLQWLGMALGVAAVLLIALGRR